MGVRGKARVKVRARVILTGFWVSVMRADGEEQRPYLSYHPLPTVSGPLGNTEC